MMSLNALKTNANPTYTPTCLESRAGDSKSFGTSLAVDGDYLAVGDPEANQVVVYTRKNDGNWQRIREINPPRYSISKKRGYGFGYEVAINNNVLAIRAYDYKNITKTLPFLGEYPKNKIKLGFETYSILLDKEQINSLQKIALPTIGDLYVNRAKDQTSILRKIQNFIIKLFNRSSLELFVDSLVFLENEITFIGKLKVSNEESIVYLFLVDSTTGKISRIIDITSSNYVDEFLNKEQELTINSLQIDSHNKSLIMGFMVFSLPKSSLYLVDSNGKINNVILDKKELDSLSFLKSSSLSFQELAISDNLLAIGITQPPPFSGQTTLWQRYPQLSLIDSIPKNGQIDVRDSFALISIFPYERTFNNADFNYVFIQVNKNQTITKSKIRWERPIGWKSYPYSPKKTGLIDSGSLLLNRYGTVVNLPIKNLPSSYEIKNSHCRSK